LTVQRGVCYTMPMTKKRAFFIIKAILFSIFALGIALFAMPLMHQSEFYLFRILCFYVVVVLAGLFWAIALYYKLLSRMASDVLTRYDNIERILLDLRDGTKHFYREKRRAFRVKTDILAHFADKTTGDDFVKIHDISCDGAQLRTTRPLRAGDSVKLNIYLPLFPQPISSKAKVVWARPTKETKGASEIYNAGIEYTEMSDEDRERLIESINIINRMPRRK